MKRAMLILFFMVLVGRVDAATYYVGPNGNSLCNGTKDVPFSVTDNVNCRFQTPMRMNGVLKGGDTLVIDGTFNINSSLILPSGVTLQGRNGAKLIGIDRAFAVLVLQGVNTITISDLEITDGSACQETGPAGCNRETPPYGPWVQNGIYMVDVSNIIIKKVKIHGMAYRGIWFGRIKDVALEDVQILNNSFAGMDGDLGQNVNSSNSGTITFIRVTIKGSGCGERLDGTRYNCYSQSQTPTGYGDQIGLARTGGNWIFNECDISEGVSDGIDCLYMDGTGSVTINGGVMQNNAGNSVKSGGRNTTITGTNIGGDCNYFKKHPEYVWKMNADSTSYGFDHCRAKGDNLAVTLWSGTKVTLNNVKFTNVTNFAILSSGSACNGTEKVLLDQNSRFQMLAGGRAYYPSGLPDGNAQGPCGKIPATCLQADGSSKDCNDLTDPKPIQYSGITIPPPDTTPPVISQVSSGTPTQTSTTISWVLNEKATGQVEYGPSAAYGTNSPLEASFDYASHVQNLLNLTPATIYHYRVKSKDAAGNLAVSPDFTFKTTGISICVPDNSCANVACGKVCTDNCGTIFNGPVCPASCTITVPVACDKVKVGS